MDIGQQSYTKIQNLYIPFVKLILIMFTSFCSYAQPVSANKYGLIVIKNKKLYANAVQQDSSMLMLDLKKLIPTLAVDIKYGSSDNFMHAALYKKPLTTSFLRAPAAYALQKVQAELAGLGLGLKIWDAYRPYSITEKMWEKVKDDRYAADPKYGSGHNRGIAVDLTLVDLRSGREKDMGTGFDNFTDTAHSNFTKLPEEVLQNRKLLRSLMEKQGFKVLDTEWWHFYLPDSKKYALMDLDFKQLEGKLKH